jgi:AraC-like DNA-binding protein
LYGADESEPWSIFWFHAQGSLLDEYLRELDINRERPVMHAGLAPKLLALFEEVLDVVEHGYSKHRLFYASQMLAHLIALMICEHRSASHQLPSVQQKIAQTITYMKQHLSRPLRIDTLAAVANLSRSRYIGLFKQQSGYAPIDYFIRLRMHRACQLLDTTGMSVKDIATELGYEDPLYFSRQFRKVNERSPLEYRKLRKG